MPYLHLDTSALQARINQNGNATSGENEKHFSTQNVLTVPQNLQGKSRNFGGVTTAMSMSPLVATVLGILGVAVLGFGLVAALPGDGARAAGTVDTSNLQAALEALKAENTALAEENRQLREEVRAAAQAELGEITDSPTNSPADSGEEAGVENLIR